MKPTFKAMYMHRHDLALRLPLKAISKGNHGRYHTIADIGRAELIEDMGVNAKRIPTWLLPNSCLLVAGLEPTDRHKIRPDIMLTGMTNLELMRYNTEGMEHPELSTTISGRRPLGSRDGTETRRRKVWVLEGGYTADTRHRNKMREKGLQHTQLMHALQVRGFDAKLMVLTFGLGGTVYQQAAEDMRLLGVDMTSMKNMLRAIHLHSVECAVNIITQRRIMDRQKLLHSTDRPP